MSRCGAGAGDVCRPERGSRGEPHAARIMAYHNELAALDGLPAFASIEIAVRR